MKDVLFVMSRAWDNEKSESPTIIEHRVGALSTELRRDSWLARPLIYQVTCVLHSAVSIEFCTVVINKEKW